MSLVLPVGDAPAAFADLVAAPAEASHDPTAQLGRILRAARTHLDMDVGFISEFTQGRRIFRHVDSEEGNRSIEVGGSDMLEESYCQLVAQGKLPKIIGDTAKYPLAAALPLTKSLRIGAYLSTPIRLRDGSIYGTFCCFSSASDPFLSMRDLRTLEAFAELAGQQIQDVVDVEKERQETGAQGRSPYAGNQKPQPSCDE